MDPIARIEARGSGPLTYRHRGEVRTLPDPATMTVDAIMFCLYNETLPGHRDIPTWKRRVLAAQWRAHHDLPGYDSARRLCFLINRYHDELEHDLRVEFQFDLAAEFRSRAWRRLLNHIDHLPRHCWYSEAVSQDEEHAKMLAKAMADRKADGDDDQPAGPPLRTWTDQLAVQFQILDAIRTLTYVTRAVQGDKSAKAPSPSPVPQTALARATKAAEYERKKAAHKSLVARLLPHKAAEPG